MALCRDRCDFIAEALRLSYAFADSHLAYSKSLESLGPALRLFFEQIVDSSANGGASEKSVKPISPPHLSPSSSNSDSCIRFDSSSDDEDGGGGFESSIYLSNSNPGPDSWRNDKLGTNAHQAFDNFSHRSGLKTPSPPPPRSTAWDYLNFFGESYEGYDIKYPANGSVEEKADHDLGVESEKPIQVESVKPIQVESVKPTQGDKDVEVNSTSKVNGEGNPSTEPTPVEKDSDEAKTRKGEQTICEVMRELQVCFEQTSVSGAEVLKMLDTGRFRYHGDKSVYQGSSRILSMISSNSALVESLPFTEKTGSAEDEENGSDNSENLSSTLKKLCMWEKKLYEEVKIEEKLRIIQAKKSKQLKSLDQKGAADARKVDLIRSSIQTLSTKIRVAVQVIDRIAITIYKLIDEELWPRISELIQRLLEMWTAMLECYCRQSHTITEAKCLNAVRLKEKLDETHFEVAMQLKLDLQKWCLSFCNWIEAQKGYVKALNRWLSICLQYEPKDTAEGMLPATDSQEEAPPLFLIIRQWSQVMVKLEEKEVVGAIRKLVTTINHLVEIINNAELKQKLIADKDMERRLKLLEREDLRMLRMMQNHVKRMTLVAGEESETESANAGSLKPCLEHIFTAMEKLGASSVEAYKELHTSIHKGESTEETISNSPDS